MKINTNLPGILRALFGVLRIATIITAVFWLLTLSFNSWIQKQVGHDARLMASVGTIALPAGPDAVSLSSNTATAGSLTLHSLRGQLQVDLCSSDSSLVSALRLSVIPLMATLIVYAFLQFTTLRTLCANLERGEIFHEENFRLVRRTGLYLIAYTLIASGLQLWAGHILSGYFSQHVVLEGLRTTLPFTAGTGAPDFFLTPTGLLTTPGALLIGCLILAIAEAFRQGLKLKTENDLTV